MSGGRRAEVVGGGIAGFCAATALARCGWPVRLHERGRELREIGAGIFLWENALRGLEAIGALADATARGELDRSWEFRDERLRLLQSGWMMDDARLYTVLRTDLHRALADAARRDGVDVCTGSRVESRRRRTARSSSTAASGSTPTSSSAPTASARASATRSSSASSCATCATAAGGT